jgi:predicted acylesterase/phospholipase RssA
LTAANRVSIPAVLASLGQDVRQALLDGGITDPVTIPVAFDDGTPETAAGLGNGLTPNVRGTLDLNEPGLATSGDQPPDAPPQQRARLDVPAPATTTAQAAYGLRSLAPIRPR